MHQLHAAYLEEYALLHEFYEEDIRILGAIVIHTLAAGSASDGDWLDSL